jgi:hypothetical protein
MQTAPTLNSKDKGSSGVNSKHQSGIKLSDDDLREELLYRSSDYRVKPEDVPSSLMAG